MTPAFKEYPLHLKILREEALRAADPAAAVRRGLAGADLECRGRMFVVGAGKAGAAMALAAEEMLGGRIAAGVMSVPALPPQAERRVKFILGGHPVPTEGSLSAGKAAAELLEGTTKEDLVLVLLSGGGSALMELPRPGIRLGDLQALTGVLLKSGAAIHEINLLRMALSLLKGGGLARLAHPARVLTLIVSDVIGDPPQTIASGPTVYRETPPAEICAILEKFRLRESLPSAILASLDQFIAHPPEPAPLDSRVENRIIASNRSAGEAAAAAALRLGFRMDFLADDWRGEARDAGRRFAEMLIRLRGRGPACCIAGGETTVTVYGKGKGGRNLEAALAAATVLDGQPETVLATLATDGVDGPTDAAGASVDGRTIARARRLGMDPHRYLEENDSYPFFDALGDIVRTGLTGTNVMDLWTGLVYQ
ncbi:MAG: DUF4147 domain-containing protein [Anaerolineales bacterium]|nr:DUF4147 domain-containing protein [Anaerolineales bacterium]